MNIRGLKERKRKMKDSRKEYNALRKKKKFSITNWLIVVNIFAFVSILPFNRLYFGLQPRAFLDGKCLWRLITYMFIHFNWWHLAGNMFVLFILGSPCERIIGRKKYLLSYLISGVIAGLTLVISAHFFGSIYLKSLAFKIFSSPLNFAIGSSGAVFGLGALLMTLIPRLKFTIIIAPFFRVSVCLWIPSLLFGIWFISLYADIPVANTAHLGGFLSGLGFGFYFRYRLKSKYGWRYEEELENLIMGDV